MTTTPEGAFEEDRVTAAEFRRRQSLAIPGAVGRPGPRMTAKEVWPADRIQHPTTYTLHIRSRFTRHWDGTGTLACNDGKQYPTTPHVTLGDVCQRCAAIYRKEKNR